MIPASSQAKNIGSEWSYGARTRAIDALTPASGASAGHEDERRKVCLSGRNSPPSRHRKTQKYHMPLQGCYVQKRILLLNYYVVY